MSGTLWIARTEMLEHWRQPWMLVVMALGYVFWAVAMGLVFLMFDTLWADPQSAALLLQQFEGVCPGGGESAFQAVLQALSSSFVAFMFTSLPLFVAIMASYSVLHERLNGTLPFLMLAPITRWKLLLGKLLGTMAIPLVLHLTLAGSAIGLVGSLEVMEPFGAMYGRTAGWWVAFLLGVPVAGFFVGALGTIISGLSRDVRTSMQSTSFFIGILSLVIGFVLVDVSSDLMVQVAWVGVGVVLAVITLLIGSRIISRDIGPTL